MKLHLPIYTLNPDYDYNDVASLQSFCKRATELILEKQKLFQKQKLQDSNSVEVLKEIRLFKY